MHILYFDRISSTLTNSQPWSYEAAGATIRRWYRLAGSTPQNNKADIFLVITQTLSRMYDRLSCTVTCRALYHIKKPTILNIIAGVSITCRKSTRYRQIS